LADVQCNSVQFILPTQVHTMENRSTSPQLRAFDDINDGVCRSHDQRMMMIV